MKPLDTLILSAGSKAWLQDTEVTVITAIEVDKVMVVLPDGSPECVSVANLSAGPVVTRATITRSPDLATISEADWEEIARKAEIVRRLNEMPRRSAEDVRKAAESINISRTMMYYLLARWRKNGSVATALLPQQRGPRPGTVSRIPQNVEAIVESAIGDIWLNRQQASMEAVVKEVRFRCRQANLKPPSPTTVRCRIAAQNGEMTLKARRGARAARAKYRPVTGHFPETSWPLQVVQIDHTLVDAIVVDQIHRRPIGRPWLTLAIDVHTRMVAGFLLSLEPPQATSVALCLAHAVLPKEQWLSRYRVEGNWPVWGRPDTIHVDNGKDFRSEALSRGCQQYGITLDFRPVRRPQYGGHIERLIGTLMGQVHLLPGTTFSNIHEKGDYDAEKHACMTLDELQEWMTRGIIVYHSELHSRIGMPPLAAWEKAIVGTSEVPGCGLPAQIADPEIPD